MLNCGVFIVIQDVIDCIQLYVDWKGLDQLVLDDIKSWDLGDIVGVSGVLYKFGKGDLYVYIEQCEYLVKLLCLLLDKYKGLFDQEMCYCQCYVDLIVNDSVWDMFCVCSVVVDGICDFLCE